MPYNSLATVNPGDVLSSSAWGNQAKANEDYLFSGRPGQLCQFDNGADYSTSSSTFVNVDATHYSITLTINSGKVLIGFSGTINPVAGSGAYLDFTIDGTRFGNTPQGVSKNAGFVALKTGLSVGSHTFTLQWAAITATPTMNAKASTDSLPVFYAVEVG